MVHQNVKLGSITITTPDIKIFAINGDIGFTQTSAHKESLEQHHQDQYCSSIYSMPTASSQLPQHLPTIFNDLLGHIENPRQKQQIRQIMEQHYRIFDTTSPAIAKTNITHTIRTGDHAPVNSRPYRLHTQQQRVLTGEINKMLKAGQIRPSNSPWSSPVLLVKKKDGSVRFVVDYRKLNNITIKDSYPIPHIEETLSRLNGHRFFSKLDLKTGYYQIPIQEVDRQKTAFIIPNGLFEFNVLAMGLKNAPPSFQRIMNDLIANTQDGNIV
ncbi:unnamed protein product [Didymodactylos carnosus]|nr:unnamed protein product [Didymodactylos carnosus]CAF4397870.1 unnamed protein product [Didymodactylos carnosus]